MLKQIDPTSLVNYSKNKLGLNWPCSAQAGIRLHFNKDLLPPTRLTKKSALTCLPIKDVVVVVVIVVEVVSKLGQ